MSPAYRAHPEFGYFCPSRRFRRKLWAALAVIALGTLASAVVVGGSRESRDDASPPPAPVNAASASAPTASAVDEATAVRPVSPERPKPACEGETWTYLDGKCIAGKAPKPRIATIDSPPIAAIPLGRIAPPPAAAQLPAKAERAGEAAAAPPAPKPERVAEAEAAPPSKSQRATDAAAAAPAVATAPAAAEPAVQSTSASKDRRKAARDRAPRDERRSARATSSEDRRSKSATGWTKQVRSAEQFMRVLFSSGI